jgi:predicted Na+-dependent transporter
MLANIIKICLPLSLMAVMFTQGLELKLSELLAIFKERPLVMVRSLVVVLVLGPYRRTGSTPSIQAIACDSYRISDSCGVASPAVSTPQYSQEGREPCVPARPPPESCASLDHHSASSSVPLSRSAGFQAEVSVFEVGKTVAEALLLPVVVGMVFAAVFPKLANRIGPTLGKIAEIALYVMVVLVLIKTSSLLLKMDAWSYVVMTIFIIVNFGLGHLLGPRDAQERTTLAMESGARNFGLAMTIGVLNFSAERALAVLIPYIILFAVISTLYLKWRAKKTATG